MLDAARVLAGRARRIDEATGASVFFKCENLQRTGASKFRGAFNALSRLSVAQRRGGVLAYSSGNHAQAVALAARELGTAAVIVMPRDAPRLKLDATRAHGAEVLLYDRHATDRETFARQVAAERGLPVIAPGPVA